MIGEALFRLNCNRKKRTMQAYIYQWPNQDLGKMTITGNFSSGNIISHSSYVCCATNAENSLLQQNASSYKKIIVEHEGYVASSRLERWFTEVCMNRFSRLLSPEHYCFFSNHKICGYMSAIRCRQCHSRAYKTISSDCIVRPSIYLSVIPLNWGYCHRWLITESTF